jgi:predicted aconitase with swiveling domain
MVDNKAGKPESRKARKLDPRTGRPEIVIKCRGLVKGRAEGEALVAPTTLSFWGEVDPISGRIIASGHQFEGRSLRGKVLVIESTKGSSATPLVIGLAASQGNAPVAFINTNIDALAVLGCVVNEIPMVTELEQDPFELIKTGDRVCVDADNGVVIVTKKEQPADSR